MLVVYSFFFFQAEDGIRDTSVTGVQTCALPIFTGRRHDLIAIPVIDPREEELPDVGLLTLEDAETGEQIELNTSDRSVRQGFLKAAAERMDARLRDFRRKRIDAISLRTNEDYVPALQSFFRARERRL